MKRLNRYSLSNFPITTIVTVIIIILVAGSFLLMIQRSNNDYKTFIYTSRTTYLNSGETSQNLDTTFYTFNIFMNTSWQTAYLNTGSEWHTLDHDSNGNDLLIFDSSPLAPGGNVSIAFSLRVETRQRNPPKIQFQRAEELQDIPKPLQQQFCMLEGTWNNDSALQSLAQTIWIDQNKTSNILRIVVSLADWIGSNVQSMSHDIPYYPNETYSYLEGDCDDQANLLIALCRVLGIPAYLQIGGLQWPSSTGKYWNGHVISQLTGISYHAWAMIFIPPWGWLPFDMTLGWNANNPLNVINLAKTWKPETLIMANITEEDWAGEGRRVKELILASTVNIHYEDELIPVGDSFLTLLRNDHFLSGLIIILMILLSFWFIKRFKLADQRANFVK